MRFTPGRKPEKLFFGMTCICLVTLAFATELFANTDVTTFLTDHEESRTGYIIHAGLTIDILHTDGTCGLPNGSATVIITGGTAPFTYLWSTGSMEPSISDLAEGTYSVTGIDADDVSESAEVEILNPGPVDANASATDQTFPGVNNGTATADPIGGSPPYTFMWNNGQNTQTIINLAPGAYTVIVIDIDDCEDIETVEVLPAPCYDIDIVGEITDPSCFGICDGVIQVTPVGGTQPYMYEWSTGHTNTAVLTDLHPCAGCCGLCYHDV